LLFVWTSITSASTTVASGPRRAILSQWRSLMPAPIVIRCVAATAISTPQSSLPIVSFFIRAFSASPHTSP
jgi:hypothetical protein